MTGARLALARATPPGDVISGLTATPRGIPCKYFYDENGAALFQRICTLAEYYPTRTEIGILERHSGAIRGWIGPDTRLVEFGSGSGQKTRLLLRHLHEPHEYVPIDICAPQLVANARSLRRTFPGLVVKPVHGDYTSRVSLYPNGRARRTVVFFPGSTIGNFEPLEASAFLRRAADLAGPAGGLLIGVDLQKPVAVLERAYNDAAGVTAAFNRNILAHVNVLCGADFDLSRFEHVAFYDARASRIEMHLRSVTAQTVTLGYARVLQLARGELIATEHSYKYDVDEFRELVREAGFVWRHTWLDARRWFSVHAFDVEPRCSPAP